MHPRVPPRVLEYILSKAPAYLATVVVAGALVFLIVCIVFILRKR